MLQSTLDRLDEAGFKAEFTSDTMSILSDPELYIIVDGHPNKDKIVWQGLVDNDNVKRAVEKLKIQIDCTEMWMKVVLMKLPKRQ